MRYLPDSVRFKRDTPFGPGYTVNIQDGTEHSGRVEWWRYAWQATARAHGWRPANGQQVAVLHTADGGPGGIERAT